MTDHEEQTANIIDVASSLLAPCLIVDTTHPLGTVVVNTTFSRYPTNLHNTRMVRRSRRKKVVASKKKSEQQQGSLIWTVLLLGLVFCVVDFGYLFYATHFQVINSSPMADGGGVDVLTRIQHQQAPAGDANRAELLPDEQPQHAADYADKERVIQVLRDAKMDKDLTPEKIDRLPTWQQVVDRLGPEPRIHGLDSCHTFQTTIDPPEALIAPAGAFNSGTNLMAELLIANCYNPARKKKYASPGVRWQVNWGKHQPPKFRLDHGVYHDNKAEDMPNENILPVVTIRDPYAWLQSMCRNRYVGSYSTCMFGNYGCVRSLLE
jgi:hypothetical protein